MTTPALVTVALHRELNDTNLDIQRHMCSNIQPHTNTKYTHIYKHEQSYAGDCKHKEQNSLVMAYANQWTEHRGKSCLAI